MTSGLELSSKECSLLCGYFHGCDHLSHTYKASTFGPQSHFFINVFQGEKLTVSINLTKQTITDKTKTNPLPESLQDTTSGQQILRLLQNKIKEKSVPCCICRSMTSHPIWIRSCAMNDQERTLIDLAWCKDCDDAWSPLTRGSYLQDVLWIPTVQSWVHLPHSKWYQQTDQLEASSNTKSNEQQESKKERRILTTVKKAKPSAPTPDDEVLRLLQSVD